MIRRIFALLAFTLLSYSACAAVEVPGPASPGFKPKIVYDVSLDQAWRAVVSALSAKGLSLSAMSSKDNLQLSTEYSAAMRQDVAFGLLGANFIRYKFNVFFVPKAAQTTITIRPVLESSNVAGGLADARTEPFVDVSMKNEQTVSVMRDWLYEQIEKNLKEAAPGGS